VLPPNYTKVLIHLQMVIADLRAEKTELQQELAKLIVKKQYDESFSSSCIKLLVGIIIFLVGNIVCQQS
jgi:hypothetical protein